MKLLLDSDSVHWTVTNEDGSISVDAIVPGEGKPPEEEAVVEVGIILVHGALMHSGIIKDDPYYGKNDTKLRWVCDQDWTYSASVALNDEWRSCNRILLVCHGLDTAAIIRINNKLLAETDNMFVRYTFDITEFCRADKINLAITFKNMKKYAKQCHDDYPYEVPDDFTPVTYGEKYRNYVRKQQCSFSWDWGPCFLPCGIWRDIELVGLKHEVHITDVVPNIRMTKDGNWDVEITTWFQSDDVTDLVYECSVAGVEQRAEIKASAGDNHFFSNMTVLNENVSLWWPNGYGEQALYDLTIKLTSNGSGGAKATKQVGFRTIELIQEPYQDQEGTSFYFKVNGIAIFCKGANFIPVDAFDSRVTNDIIRDIILSCLDANMNMLRIWGGGIYQCEEFYSMCDKYGIMVWQEFMFACAMYPVNKKFLESVRDEVEHQVKRLSSHTSIVLWSGNNENEEALITSWYEPVKKNLYVYTVDYHRLYHETIMPTVLKIDHTRSFISSSPSNGTICLDPFVERYKVDNPHAYGDTHYYNYRDDGTDYTKFPKCRFASEYGFQAFPCFSTFKKVSLQSDWYPMAPFLIRRNHHRYGQEEIAAHLQMHFSLPFDVKAETSLSEKQFGSYLWMTQVVQALYVKAQTEYYRTLMSSQYHCMGALYWQCNDIWQAPTWAGIEYGGKWKLLHNYVKEFFQPVLVCALKRASADEIEIYLVNDYNYELSCSVKIDAWSVSMNQLFMSKELNFVLAPRSSSLVKKVQNVAELIPELTTQTLSDIILRLRCFDSTSKILSSNICFLNGLKSSTSPLLKMKPPKVLIHPVAEAIMWNGCQEFFFDIEVDVCAPFVTLEMDNEKAVGRFHPNGFFAFPGEKHRVSYRLLARNAECQSINQSELLPCIKVSSLFDSYQK